MPIRQLLQERPPAMLRLPINQQPYGLHWLLLLLLLLAWLCSCCSVLWQLRLYSAEWCKAYSVASGLDECLQHGPDSNAVLNCKQSVVGRHTCHPMQ
jgi:hypothetical protein